MNNTSPNFATGPSAVIAQPPPPALMECRYSFFSLLIPTKDIVTLANSQQVTSSADAKTQIIVHADQPLPVISMNDDFEFLPFLCKGHEVIVLLRSDKYLFGLSCQSFKKIDRDLNNKYPVPNSMRSVKQPFKEFFVADGKILGVTSAAALLHYFTERGLIISSQDAQLPQVQGSKQ